MNWKNPLSFIVLFLTTYLLIAQTPTQTVRGQIVDKQAQIPLIGATVVLVNSDPLIGGTSDENGYYRLEKVPVGRQQVKISYLGYQDATIPNVIVNAGKEVILDIELEESVVLTEALVIKATREKHKTVNSLATISARSFDTEEVYRFSGGRNDAARLVANFAGVGTADDTRNDIIIRGNSPTGVLWRLEGMPVPNPNHFSTLGTTGGPVSALNTNLLKDSDFLTSAFPSEYGNALAGVFDIGLRSGNNEKFEFTAQLAAFSGFEVMAEGPINKEKRSSFLTSYRYSFAKLADILNVDIGTNSIPTYQDLSLTLNLGSGKLGSFYLFGIGALSHINFLGDNVAQDDFFANPNEDAYVNSRIGILGLRHNLVLNKTTYIKTVIGTSHAKNTFDRDDYMDDGSKQRAVEVRDQVNRFTLSSFLNKKFNARHTLRTGIMAEQFMLDIFNRDRVFTPDWSVDRDFEGGVTVLQAYAQSQYKLSNQFTINTGLHGQYLQFNNTYAIEPRLAVNWAFSPKHTVNVGYGLHHQMQPLPIYFMETPQTDGTLVKTNEGLDFTRSHHFVAGHDFRFWPSWRLKTEVYYQAIQNVPIEQQTSTFSMLNAGNSFVLPEVPDLVNEGTGRNYGLEITLEKFFSQGFYGLLSTSLFESKYKGSDGIERNTAFNNQYIVNLLAGKEFKIGKANNHVLTFDFKVTRAGGRYYTPVNLVASQLAGFEILQEDKAFSERNPAYFRLDMKVGARINDKKGRFSQHFFIDFQNITDHDNVFTNRYNDLTNEVNTIYQIGFLPDLLYRVQF